MKTTRFAVLPALLIIGIGTCVQPSFAQVSSANITGTILDTNSASVPDAKVEITNKNTLELRTATTTADGRYTFSILIPGTYELTVQASGFKKAVQSDIILTAGQSAEVNLKLELGSVAESVDVSATPVTLDTQTASQAANLSQEQVTNLPVNYRNPIVLVYATAGVKSMMGQVNIRSVEDTFMDMDFGLFAMNGGREGQVNLSVDGLSIKGGDWGMTYGYPQVDAVQEMQITRNTYDAEYSRVGNGVVNIVTKGGSNAWHGDLFEFLRNDKLEANQWAFNKAGQPKPPVRRNQFGGTASGPMWSSKKLFFLFGYERGRIREGVGDTVTVPTMLQRAGNFSQTYNPDGSLQVIYDPLTTVPNPNGSGYVRSPFPGNIIPSNRIDPVGAGVANILLPSPTGPGSGITGANNWFGSATRARNSQRWDGRQDWARTEKHSMFLHVTRSYFDEFQPRRFNTGVEDNQVSTQGTNKYSPDYTITLSNTFVPTPTWVINFLIGGGGAFNTTTPVGMTQGVTLQSIGYSKAVASEFPITSPGAWNLENYVNMGNASVTTQTRRTNSLGLHTTHEMGAHSLKFGFTATDQILNNFSPQSMTMAFTHGPTDGPVIASDATTTGNTIASLLLGLGTGSNTLPVEPASSQKQYGAYVQDTWQVTRRLTLNLGVRYDLQTARTERYNQQNYFNYNLVNPISSQVGMQLFGGEVFNTPSNRGQTQVAPLNFAPRFGIAYKLTDRLVVRSGFGISFNNTLIDNGINGNDGFAATTPWITSTGVIPQTYLSNPFPNGLIPPTGNTLGALTYVGLSPTAWRRNNPTPYVEGYSLDLQYQVTHSSVLEVGYTGNVGRRLAYGVPVNYNQLNPQYLSLGQALNNLVPNPFYGIIKSGQLSGPTIPYYQLLLPMPQFVAVNSAQSEKGTSSEFNALYVKFTHRFTGGLTVLTTYQWSKALDNASEDQGWAVNDGRRDTYNPGVEWGISAHDVPHDLVNTLVYELPVGKGKRFFSGMHGVTQAVLGGWEMSTVMRFASNTPVTIRCPNTLSAYGFAVQRCDIANMQALVLPNRTPSEWWNINAVTAPCTFCIGTSPRFLSTVRMDNVANVDMTLMKNWTMLRDRARLQFRAEAYNFTNHPLFGIPPTGPQVTFGSPAFGTVTQTFIYEPRQVQLGLKMTF